MPAPLPLHHTVRGAGPPLVLLHGLFGSSQNWGGIARGLADAVTVFSVDLRNHGRSPWDPAMTYEAMAADVAEFIRTEVPAPATVVGHSMGGKAALTLALSQPDLVARLVIADIAPVTYPTWQLPVVQAMRAPELLRVESRAAANRMLQATIPDESVRAFLLQSLARDGADFRWRLNLEAIERDMPALAGFPAAMAGRTYVGPTLALYGANSEYVDTAGLNVLESHCPELTRRPIANAGHWLHADQPDAFLAALREFR